jgi:hypothetical protein
MFSQVAAQSEVPVSISGTNTLALAGVVTGFSLAAYYDYMIFSGVAVSANTGATQAAYGGLAALPVYKDESAGPVLLSGQEIQPNNLISLIYDAALNSGGGGFHLRANTAPGALSNSASIVFPALAPGASNDQPITIFGISPGDCIALGYPSAPTSGIGYTGFAGGSTIVTVRAFNYTNATVTPSSGIYRAIAFRVRP